VFVTPRTEIPASILKWRVYTLVMRDYCAYIRASAGLSRALLGVEVEKMAVKRRIAPVFPVLLPTF
jgi:hypothetical protein